MARKTLSKLTCENPIIKIVTKITIRPNNKATINLGNKQNNTKSRIVANTVIRTTKSQLNNAQFHKQTQVEDRALMQKLNLINNLHREPRIIILANNQPTLLAKVKVKRIKLQLQ